MFPTLKVVSRYRDSQLQVGENYSYFLYFETKYLQILTYVIPNTGDLIP